MGKTWTMLNLDFNFNPRSSRNDDHLFRSNWIPLSISVWVIVWALLNIDGTRFICRVSRIVEISSKDKRDPRDINHSSRRFMFPMRRRSALTRRVDSMWTELKVKAGLFAGECTTRCILPVITRTTCSPMYVPILHTGDIVSRLRIPKRKPRKEQKARPWNLNAKSIGQLLLSICSSRVKRRVDVVISSKLLNRW